MAKKESTSPKLDAIFTARKGKKREKGSGTKKYDRNRVKCAKYRARVGKPRGRGVPGNKAGHNHV